MQLIAPGLRTQLRHAGLSLQAIEAVWPEWWSDEAEGSLSAQAELRFTVARRLGIHPASLFEDGPQFVWRDDARFKNLGDVTESEQAVLASFGLALGRTLIAATPDGAPTVPLPASDLRAAMLASAPNVGLLQLLSLAWGIGIPVVRTIVFPLEHKRMHAMTVSHRERKAVILGQGTRYPARMAFTLAHELGHVFLGHLEGLSTFLDYEDPLESEQDSEETAADRYALELLTGSPAPEIVPEVANFGSAQLAKAAQEMSGPYGIDAGVIALCIGYSTKRWQAATGALKVLGGSEDLSEQVNSIAVGQMRWEELPLGSAAYVEKMLGVSRGR